MIDYKCPICGTIYGYAEAESEDDNIEKRCYFDKELLEKCSPQKSI